MLRGGGGGSRISGLVLKVDLAYRVLISDLEFRVCGFRGCCCCNLREPWGMIREVSETSETTRLPNRLGRTHKLSSEPQAADEL